jgi:hypothetical protein
VISVSDSNIANPVEDDKDFKLQLTEGGVWATWADGRQPVLLGEQSDVARAISEFLTANRA